MIQSGQIYAHAGIEEWTMCPCRGNLWRNKVWQEVI